MWRSAKGTGVVRTRAGRIVAGALVVFGTSALGVAAGLGPFAQQVAQLARQMRAQGN